MIQLKNIEKIYKQSNNKPLVIFKGASFDMRGKKSISIMGRSGSGKSTLLNIIAGLDLDYTGEFIYNNIQLAKN